ncbi:MAG: hypothetical protein PHG06_00640 [Parabacteroides sp.]|nr:hypothetical protein [Parabacteroides sp.]
MDLADIPTDLLLQHIDTLQNMLVHMVRYFPHTGCFDQDVEEMKQYIYKWESEADARHLSYKHIDERLQEIN